MIWANLLNYAVRGINEVSNLSDRIRNKKLLARVVTPAVAAGVIKDGMNIATSGYKKTGYPRAFFSALSDRARRGEINDLNLWSVCLMGYEVEGVLAETGALKRRLGSHGDPVLRKAINNNKVSCNDIRSEVLPWMVRSKLLGNLDVAIVDAVAITEEGHIIPSHSTVDIASYIESADIVIVEIDHAIPAEMEGMHDIFLPALPPHRKEIPLYDISQRIGTPYIIAGEDKINYIIECQDPYPEDPEPSLSNHNTNQIADHLIEFFKFEISRNRLPGDLLPIECGIGAIADSVLKQLTRENFKNLEFYSAGITDGMIELTEMGRVKSASGTGLRLTAQSWSKFCNNIEKYKNKIILRPIEVINNPEMIRRLGIIAINGAIEADIYGNINNSHIGGTSLVNGVGGSGVFASNGYLSVFTLLSTGKGGNISTIVPMVTHVDLPDHNVDVVVTEQGLADLRGLSPIEKARAIIKECAHPDYKPLLTDYLERAVKQKGGHQPHILEEAFSFHLRLAQKGSMLSL